MDGTQGNKKRRGKEIRFVSSTDNALHEVATTGGESPPQEAGRSKGGLAAFPPLCGAQAGGGGARDGLEPFLCEVPSSSLVMTPTTAEVQPLGTAPQTERDAPDACKVVVTVEGVCTQDGGVRFSPGPTHNSYRLRRQSHKAPKGKDRADFGGKGKSTLRYHKRLGSQSPGTAADRRASLASASFCSSLSLSTPVAHIKSGASFRRSVASLGESRERRMSAGAGSANAPASSSSPAAAATVTATTFDGILPATTLLLMAAEREAARANGTLSSTRGNPRASADWNDELQQEDGKDGEGDGASARPPGAMDGSQQNYRRKQQAQDSYFVHTHMQSVAQAKQSQVQMRAFERVLKTMEEEAIKVRRRVRQNTSVAHHSRSNSPGMSFGGSDNTRGDERDSGVQQSERESDSALRESEVPGEEGEDEGDEEQEDDDGEDDAVGLLYIGDGEGKRYTPLVRRQQQQAGGGGAGSTLGRFLTVAQQQRILRRQLVAAERFLREHPEMEETLRKELIASESRLSAARTVRSGHGIGERFFAATTTATTTATTMTTAMTTTATQPVERFDWAGYTSTGITRNGSADSDREAPGTGPPSDKQPSPKHPKNEGESEAKVETEGNGMNSTTTDPSPLVRSPAAATATTATTATATAAAPTSAALVECGSPISCLSDSLQNLPYEDQLAELLERGNGRSVYGAEGPRRTTHVARRRSARSAKASGEREKPTGGASPQQQQEGPHHEALSTAERRTPSAELSASMRARDDERRVTFTIPKTAKAAAATTTTNATTATARGASSAGKPKTVSALLAEAASAVAAKSKRSAKRHQRLPKRKPREALPVVLGVGNRAAAELKKELMQTRLEEMETQMATSKDTRRTCDLLARLRPMREELIHRDVLDGYDVTDPREWANKYPRRSDGPPSSSLTPTSLPRIASAPHREADDAAMDDTAAHGSATPTVHAGAGVQKCVTASVTLERHRKQIFAKTFELAEEQRKRSRLLFIDVLESMGEKQIARATWPAAQAALNHARHILLHEPYEHQSFIGFQKIVHSHFSLLQLIQWPVQQMLEQLAALFLLSSREYKEWLANLYQKLSNCHDYEARFRAIDRTIKGKDIPDEAHVRIVLHSCRRLPRTYLLGSTHRSANGNGAARTTPTPTTTRDISPSFPVLSPTKAVQRPPPPLPPSSSSNEGAAAFNTTVPPSFHQSPPSNLQHSNLTSPLVSAASPIFTLPSAKDSGSPRNGESGPASCSHASPYKHSNRTPVNTSLVDPYSPSATNLFVRNAASVSDAAEPEYAVRIEAERQTITSSAVPAVGARPNGGGAEGKSNSKDSHAGGKGAAASSSSIQGKSVSFFDQTFKLHLYEASSPIRLTLMRDGQPIADGSFSVHRYGSGRKIQLWLPLSLTQAATGNGVAFAGSSHSRKKTEIKMTVELI